MRWLSTLSAHADPPGDGPREKSQQKSTSRVRIRAFHSMSLTCRRWPRHRPPLSRLGPIGRLRGLRWGGLAGLRRARVDLLWGRVTVAETLVEVGGQVSFGEPKTRNSARTVPSAPHCQRIADSPRGVHIPESDALMFTTPGGEPLHRSAWGRSCWKPATRAAKLGPLKVHELRHTFVALWIDAGLNPKEVSIRAGHSSVAFTLDR